MKNYSSELIDLIEKNKFDIEAWSFCKKIIPILEQLVIEEIVKKDFINMINDYELKDLNHNNMTIIYSNLQGIIEQLQTNFENFNMENI